MQAEYWLVWLHGTQGPTAQKWVAECFETHPTRLRNLNLMARHPLSAAEARLTLDVLAKRYPPPARNKETMEVLRLGVAAGPTHSSQA